jgi:hypothetical protein
MGNGVTLWEMTGIYTHGVSMSRKNSLNVGKIIERAKQYLKIRTDAELATALDLKPNAITMWKSRGSADIAAILTICESVSADWLLYGIGSPELGTEMDRTTRLINEMIRDMEEEQRRDILKKIQVEKLLNNLLQERKAA